MKVELQKLDSTPLDGFEEVSEPKEVSTERDKTKSGKEESSPKLEPKKKKHHKLKKKSKVVVEDEESSSDYTDEED